MTIQIRLFSLIFLIATTVAPQSQPPRKDIPAIAKAANGGVVSIVMMDSNGSILTQGSGFLVSKDGRVITNYHVIENGASAIVKLPNGAFFLVDGVLAIDKARDVAVIKAHGEDFRTLTLGNSDLLQVGEEVVAIGNPLSLESTVSNGILSGIRKGDEEGGTFLQITTPISPGSSGGPLTGADLTKADLGGASLVNSDLIGANLHGANLSGADLWGVDLDNANLSQTLLYDTDFTETSLDGTDFSGSVMDRTIFANVDLRNVKGLESVMCEGPCSINIETIFLSEGKIPEVFLRGAGVPESLSVYIRSLVVEPIEYYSCFISYSTRDQKFAGLLHSQLRGKGARVWLATEDLKIGDRFRAKIDEAIRLYDKLLLVLSENSVKSQWVEAEVEAAFEKEQKQKRTVLFPIRLDDAVMDTEEAWAADIRRTRHIGDFRNWKDHDEFQNALERLLRDLKSKE